MTTSDIVAKLWNLCNILKDDGVTDHQPTQAEREAVLGAQYPDCIMMSTRRASDIALLREAIVAFFRQDLVEAGLSLPWSAQQLRGEIFASCEVLEERADAEGAFLRVRGGREMVKGLCERFGQAL